MEPKRRSTKRRTDKKREDARARRTGVELRPHQSEALAAFQAGRRNQYHIWHRRAGKDWFGMFLASEIGRAEVGTYWHLLPKHVQAKRAIWSGIDHVSGKRFLELFFPDAVAVNNTEMFIERESGSTWQLLGSDNYDRMVGSNPRGVVFSEWALCDPRAWDYIRPILRANKGWAIFITTFRGRNHAYHMYQNLKGQSDWYTSLKTVNDTGILRAEEIDAERRTGMSERLIRQEYFCEPAPPPSLGPYARAVEALDRLGSVRELPETFVRDSTRYLSVGIDGDYMALLVCSQRGETRYIYGGKLVRHSSVAELLGSEYQAALAVGRAILLVDEQLNDEVMLGLRAPLAASRSATLTETATFIERSYAAPSSLLVAAATGSVETFLTDDEEPNLEQATSAVYGAIERLASSINADEWGKAPNYLNADKSVIGIPTWRH